MTDDRCHFCDVPFVNGQCPECRSIKLVELWRRQDMDEMLTEVRSDPLPQLEPKRAA